MENYSQSASQNKMVIQVQTPNQVVINIASIPNLETREQVADVLDYYLSGILTDKNKIPLEIILGGTDLGKELDFYHVPLPKIFTELDVTYYGLNPLNTVGNLGIRHAIEAIAENPHMVVIGNPGSGKTTLINYLSVIMAKIIQSNDEEMKQRLSNDSNNKWGEYSFPVSIQIRSFANSSYFGRGGRDALVDYIISQITGVYTHLEKEIRAHVLNEMLRKGKMLIVLDGLDLLPRGTDTPAEQRQKLREILMSFAEDPQLGKNRIIVTSRSYAYHQEDMWNLGDNFSVAELLPFNKDQIEQYIRYWLIQLDLLKKKTISTHVQLSQETIEKYTQNYLEFIIGKNHILTLAKTPLILTFIVSQFGANLNGSSKHQLSRLELYDNVIKMLVKRWSIYSSDTNLIDSTPLHEQLHIPSYLVLESLLSIVAFEAHKRMEEKEEDNTYTDRANITKETIKWAWNIIKKKHSLIVEPSEELWDKLETRAGILLPSKSVEDGDKIIEKFEFPHLSLQEALAAKAINSRTREFIDLEYFNSKYITEPLQIQKLVVGLLEKNWERWQMVISLLLEMLNTQFPDDFQRTTNAILEDTRENPIPIDDPGNFRWYGALTLGKFCFEGFANANNDQNFANLKKWLELSLRYKAMNINDRYDAALYLSSFGDNKISINLSDASYWSISTSNYWCKISKGVIFLGSPDYVKYRHLSENRPHEFLARNQEQFFIGKYPVTNNLFAEFCKSGYCEKKYWDWCRTSEDWSRILTQLEKWNFENLVPTTPCVDVTWFEAMAFCKWFTEVNCAGLEISLPTEVQWLAAAQNGVDTLYIGTDSVSQAKQNRYYGRLTPVGMFDPNQNEVCDLCNGVAEWTRTIFAEPIHSMGENLQNINRRMTQFSRQSEASLCVKGAGYNDFDPRLGRRRGFSPSSYANWIGFRIIALPKKHRINLF